MSNFTILHTVDSLHPKAGGPSRTVVQLCDSLVKNDAVDVMLLSQRMAGEPSASSISKTVKRLFAESTSRYSLSFGLPMRSELGSLVRENHFSLIHDHGVWSPSNHWVAQTARHFEIPFIIQPRGMLEPWAMNHKAWKKRAAMALYQKRDLETAEVLIATSHEEYENLRRVGLHQPIAVIPNGVHSDQHMTFSVSKSPDLKRTVLFLSRIHSKKGLLNLIRAWGQLKLDGWRLCLAGPDDVNHLSEVMTLAKKLGVNDSVEYVGVVDGEEKSKLYYSSDLFVLPTFSENFGVVVAEALAHGVPVITTKGAPWSDLESYGCGWWVDIGVEPLVIALHEAMTLSDNKRQVMGELGREYVRRYDWDDIAQTMTEVYRWVLSIGDKPNCVHEG
ncbi:D-inositol 3-phosphate glycosyltransferase [Mariprofundus micogutta]|uniref:D-inositol 3-phosphate glycosyltransferase n=1 Tax=Mariprofundus micogutta TaxID=1921010 RepID=A0A1L8CLW0_9PROT|nr:glycosyltransferase [Mariprofundus micogutta]GAV19891.1 D-inositol 3-phosphate glycosyltransferase [Mariprofundus micogutta]